jgi:hypothetical protein
MYQRFPAAHASTSAAFTHYYHNQVHPNLQATVAPMPIMPMTQSLPTMHPVRCHKNVTSCCSGQHGAVHRPGANETTTSTDGENGVGGIKLKKSATKTASNNPGNDKDAEYDLVNAIQLKCDEDCILNQYGFPVEFTRDDYTFVYQDCSVNKMVGWYRCRSYRPGAINPHEGPCTFRWRLEKVYDGTFLFAKRIIGHHTCHNRKTSTIQDSKSSSISNVRNEMEEMIKTRATASETFKTTARKLAIDIHSEIKQKYKGKIESYFC